MRTVRDSEGTTYLLAKRSSDASLVRDPDTGEETYLPNEELETVDAEPSLKTAARTIPEPLRRLLTAVHDEQALGLLVEIDRRRPIRTTALLVEYDGCESDLNGLLGEFRAAGLIEETTVLGQHAYRTTSAGHDALATLQGH